MAFDTDARIVVNGRETVTLEGATYEIPHKIEFFKSYKDGTADGKADLVHKDERSLNVGSETLSLISLAGGTAARKSAADNFATVKGLVIKNTTAAGTSGYLRIGAASSNAFDGTGTPFQATGSTTDIEPGTCWAWFSHAGASTSSASNLEVEAVTSNMTYEIAIIGESA